VSVGRLVEDEAAVEGAAGLDDAGWAVT
jgi:hypothetical protein